MSGSLFSLTSLDENTFEKLLLQLTVKENKIQDEFTINLESVKFIDPYGMIGLLEFGWHLRKRSGITPILSLPQSGDVLKYLERMDFFKNATPLFKIEPATIQIEERFLRSRYSDVLLEITKIEGTDDIHSIVDRIKEGAEVILRTHLHYDNAAIDSFIVALSEICQNIPEHSQDVGYVGIQKYFYGKKLGKNVVKIAVMDLGIGIKESLTQRYGDLYGEKWSNVLAIKLALLKSASRYDDIDRGHGLTSVRKLVKKWNGKFMIRFWNGKGRHSA